jgi:hypothetical protein
MESSPTSFHTVQEFQSPPSFPSYSEFEGFSDDDNWTLQTLAPDSDRAPDSQPAALLAAPPTCNSDGSLRTFPSLEEAFSFCQTWARDQGYAIRKYRNKSRGKDKVVYKVYIQCECAGKKQGSNIPDKYRIRKDQASKACDCPFKGSITEKNGLWSIQITCPDHDNHLPLLRPADSAIHRRAGRAAYPEFTQQVYSHLQTRIQPKKTIDDWLLRNPGAPVILQDIYNLVASAKKERDGGLSPIQALFSKQKGTS